MIQYFDTGALPALSSEQQVTIEKALAILNFDSPVIGGKNLNTKGANYTNEI